jgi:hypothetical protein
MAERRDGRRHGPDGGAVVRRLDRGDEPSRAELVALDEATMSKRFDWLGMFGVAADPP